MTPVQFSHLAPSLPDQPGIYKYFDTKGQLIYVGKAKHIRKRVSSYFTKQVVNQKTQELVKRIEKIEFTIVDSEADAFLLENSLIKEFKPRFNILLKDDKTYPFIVIRKEDFPRVFLTRQKTKDGSTYLGPFTSVYHVRELLNFIRQSIPLRTCALDLSPKKIAQKKYKVCLEYHLGNCKGPCEGLQSVAEYQEGLNQVRDLLQGNLGSVIKVMETEMKSLAASLAFEKAAQQKMKIEFLRQYQARSVVANVKTPTLDVFSISQGEQVFVNYLMVRNGAIIQTRTVELQQKLEETPAELLAFAINQLREQFGSKAPEIVVPFSIEYPDPTVTIVVPKTGDKKKLVELSLKNAEYYIADLKRKQRLQLTQHPEDKEKLITDLQQDLQLPIAPQHIECFDNSNFQGSFPVSAVVCFKNGVPSKKDYRKFNIKTVEGISDFASMKEAVYRHYKRVQEENNPLPQLVIIDGGKGQLNAAQEAISELGLQGSLTIVGLAKNEEELFFAGDTESLKLPYNCASLRLIRRIRDEVHRFGLSFHRQQRSKGTFKNQLQEIPGIGAQTATALLKHFRSVKNLEQASLEEIAKVAGNSKAKKILAYFKHSP
jgi:excinuclease ABC subunit C